MANTAGGKTIVKTNVRKDLKIARIRKDLTQKQLGNILKMSPATINRIETGAKPIDSIKIGDLAKICNALDISIHEVLNKYN